LDEELTEPLELDLVEAEELGARLTEGLGPRALLGRGTEDAGGATQYRA